MEAKRPGQVTIGVFGLHPGAGATHLTVLLATFLSRYRKKKSIVIEESGKNAFRHLEIFLYGEAGGAEDFGSRRCRYRKCFQGGKDMAERQAECLIYDLGCSYAAAAEHLARCDIKWVIGSSGIFHADDWERFLEKREVREQILLRGADSWHFLQNHAVTGKRGKALGGRDAWKRRLEIYGLGTEEDLLHLSPEAICLFSRMSIP